MKIFFGSAHRWRWRSLVATHSNPYQGLQPSTGIAEYQLLVVKL